MALVSDRRRGLDAGHDARRAEQDEAAEDHGRPVAPVDPPREHQEADRGHSDHRDDRRDRPEQRAFEPAHRGHDHARALGIGESAALRRQRPQVRILSGAPFFLVRHAAHIRSWLPSSMTRLVGSLKNSIALSELRIIQANSRSRHSAMPGCSLAAISFWRPRKKLVLIMSNLAPQVSMRTRSAGTSTSSMKP